MTIEEALVAQLKAHAGLAALVGTRVFAAPLPQDVTYPAVTYSRIVSARTHVMVADTGLVDSLFQIDCWASEAGGHLSLINVAKQTRLALQDFSGILGGGGGVSTDRIFIENEFDMPFERDTRSRHRVLEFTIWHIES